MNRRGCQLTAAPRQQLAEIPSSFPRYLGTSEGAHGAVVAEVVGRYYAPARPTASVIALSLVTPPRRGALAQSGGLQVQPPQVDVSK